MAERIPVGSKVRVVSNSQGRYEQGRHEPGTTLTLLCDDKSTVPYQTDDESWFYQHELELVSEFPNSESESSDLESEFIRCYKRMIEILELKVEEKDPVFLNNKDLARHNEFYYIVADLEFRKRHQAEKDEYNRRRSEALAKLTNEDRRILGIAK
jgi:hypothetical protein